MHITQDQPKRPSTKGSPGRVKHFMQLRKILKDATFSSTAPSLPPLKPCRGSDSLSSFAVSGGQTKKLNFAGAWVSAVQPRKFAEHRMNLGNFNNTRSWKQKVKYVNCNFGPHPSEALRADAFVLLVGGVLASMGEQRQGACCSGACEVSMTV